jgi:hypothetical protein
MSLETIVWAKQQVCGCPYAKAVLVELANWSRADGICEFRRVSDIAAVTEVSERTVQRALKRLEERQEDGGLALIRRLPRCRKDGGQQANRFELVGYRYPGDCQSSPTVVGPQKLDSSAPQGRLIVTGGCQIDGGGGDHPVTPYKDLDSNLIPSPLTPRAKSAWRRPIAADWCPAAIENLPEKARAFAAQWPTGTYVAEAEAFHQHWLGTGQSKANWDALWASRILTLHCSISRASRGGNAVGHGAGAEECASLSLPEPAKSQQLEDLRSAAVRDALAGQLSDISYARYVSPAAFVFDEPGLKVLVRSSIQRDWLESNLADVIHKVARHVEPGLRWVMIDVEIQGGAQRRLHVNRSTIAHSNRPTLEQGRPST